MTDTQANQQDLTVRGESIERVFGIYVDGRYLVNRRYQRKLIWTLEEKIAFIDSIRRGYPVPIILLAEDRATGQSQLEIIDGMQRLNAVMSFIENEYAVDGCYFDLNSMAKAKELLDEGILTQRQPVMDRATCVRIAGYQLPFSIFEFSSEASVDEVFRRINSGGRQLSRQELRAAGAIGLYPSAVRIIASKIRGDASHSDFLSLNDMKKISITNRDLHYGVAVDDVFWIKHGILSRDQVRQSRDEEQVADILAYMVSDEPVSSRTELLDDYFGLGGEEASEARREAMDAMVQRRTLGLVVADFQRTLDELILTIDSSGDTFNRLVFSSPQQTAPRYFQAIFLAFYQLIVKIIKRLGIGPLSSPECAILPMQFKCKKAVDGVPINEAVLWMLPLGFSSLPL